jgi:hypothetical protein
MRLPRVGQWVMIFWTDAGRADGWHDADEDQAQVLEITTGMCRGKTPDRKVKVAPTVAIGTEDGRIYFVLGEVEIPIGTIATWVPIPEPEMPNDNGVSPPSRAER